MKRLSQQQKLLGGFFCIVASAWVVDWLSGGTEPTSAAASPAPQSVSDALPVPPDPPDLDAVIASLRDDRPSRAALPIDEVQRDLFTPTARMRAVLAPVAPTLSAEANPDEHAAPPLPAFEDRHELQGVLTGRVPLAVIDGVLYRRGSEIDGYRLIELGRDRAVLIRDGTRVTLEVTRRADR
jgi:hypothetical protein